MTEKRTAEEIVSKNDIDKGPPHWVTRKSAIVSCEEYAAQERDKVRNQAIQECIDIVSVTPGDENVIPKLERLKYGLDIR